MKLPDNIHDPEREDLIRQIEVLFDTYGYDHLTRQMYWSRLDNDGPELLMEEVKRDLPDGFSRGRFLLKDINRELNRKGC